jgi:FMN phosphatase YigB (HAD superfamily)
MSEAKIILTDCDGVLLNWEYAFHQWMEVRGYQIQRKNEYSIAKSYGLESSEGSNLVQIFNESAAMGFLPSLRDSQHILLKLRAVLGYRFVAITSMSEDRYAKILRERNLAKLFGPTAFKEVHCLPCGADKTEALEEAAEKYPGAYWVEDNTRNAEIGASLGLEARIMEHGYNMDYNGEVKVVKNWKEIYDEIVEIENDKDH